MPRVACAHVVNQFKHRAFPLQCMHAAHAVPRNACCAKPCMCHLCPLSLFLFIFELAILVSNRFATVSVFSELICLVMIWVLATSDTHVASDHALSCAVSLGVLASVSFLGCLCLFTFHLYGGDAAPCGKKRITATIVHPCPCAQHDAVTIHSAHSVIGHSVV